MRSEGGTRLPGFPPSTQFCRGEYACLCWRLSTLLLGTKQWPSATSGSWHGLHGPSRIVDPQLISPGHGGLAQEARDNVLHTGYALRDAVEDGRPVCQRNVPPSTVFLHTTYLYLVVCSRREPCLRPLIVDVETEKCPGVKQIEKGWSFQYQWDYVLTKYLVTVESLCLS